jgi:predicted extracellular nuclease
MQIVNGQQYTLSFIPSGIDLSIMGSLADSVLKQLQDDGFPISQASARSNGIAGGFLSTNSIDVTFVYTGQATDDVSLGSSMASDLTDSFTTSSFNYNGATSGTPATSTTDAIKKVLGIDTANPTSFSTVAIIGIAILILIVAVFGFSEGAGARV